MVWSGVENGELFRRAAASGFDAVVTKDSGVQYEQNLVNLPLAVVILHALTNDIDDIRPLIPALVSALENLPPRQITHVT
jgi:hypothetical protein